MLKASKRTLFSYIIECPVRYPTRKIPNSTAEHTVISSAAFFRFPVSKASTHAAGIMHDIYRLRLRGHDAAALKKKYMSIKDVYILRVRLTASSVKTAVITTDTISLKNMHTINDHDSCIFTRDTSMLTVLPKY